MESGWISQAGYQPAQHWRKVHIFIYNCNLKMREDENRRRENVRILLIEKRKREKSCQGDVQIVD